MTGDVKLNTPDYSDGKIGKKGEGALRFAVFTDSNHRAVVIHFGSHVRWLTLDKETARTLGETILKEADSL